MVRKILFKFITAYVWLRHGYVPGKYRYFYRDTYYCMLVQLKYFYADFIQKRPYKNIQFSGEFGAELLFVIPFAYWHYKNGTLKETMGCNLTSPFYYFSPNHKEVFAHRSNEGNYNYEMPRILFSQNYNIKKWLPVPFAAHYSNEIFRYDKPILVIANRYNMEWNGPPISFMSIAQLDEIIKLLKNKYQIIYNRPRPAQITEDNSIIYDLNEYDWLREKHADVLLFEDLYQKHQHEVTNFNHLQLMVYANCKHFISTHGGTGTLASYFGGINILLSKRGEEHYFHCFEKLLPQLSGAKVIHVKTDEDLFKQVQKELA